MLPIWIVILVLWLPLALIGSGMAFEGKTAPFQSYLAIANFWFYPTLVFVAWFFRRRNPRFIFIPLLAIATGAADLVARWP